MKIKILIYIIVLAVCTISIWKPVWTSSTPDNRLLTIKTSTGNIKFHIDVAETLEQKELGLMYRRSLPENYGMLFAWPNERPIQMWMKNTLIPLDMLFIDRKGYIVYIAHSAHPLSTDVISSPKSVLAVLEIAGGEAKNNSIKVGDQVIHAVFQP